VLVVVFLATLIRSAFGFGEALVAVPLLAVRLPVTVAAPLAVMLSILVAGVVVIQDFGKVKVRVASWLVGASLLGIPAGLALLVVGNERLVKGLLACVIISFAGWCLASRRAWRLETDRRGWMLAAGFVAGVLGGAYGMNGPPLVVYGAMRRWPPQEFRATLQGYFLPASILVLIGYAIAGLLGGQVLRLFVVSLPVALLAIFLGREVNRRLKGRVFLFAVYVGLIAIGGVLLAQAARTPR